MLSLLEQQVERDGKSGGRGLEVALDAGHLSRQPQVGPRADAVPAVEVQRRVDEGVAVHLAVADEAGRFQTRKGAQDTALLGPGHPRLEADQVVLAAGEVLLAELDDRMGAVAFRGGEADRLHRPEAQGVLAATGEFLDRQAALEEQGPFELAQLDRVRLEQPAVEGPVLQFVERAVQVVVAALAVAGSPEQHFVVQTVTRDNRSDRVVEVEMVGTNQLLELTRQRFRGQGPGRDHAVALVGRRQRGQFLAPEFDQRLRFDCCRHSGGESRAVNGQGTAGRHGVAPRGGDDQRVEALHLPLEQSRGMVRVVAAQRVGAHQFGEVAAGVSRCGALRPHLVQSHGAAPGGELESALATGEPAANDYDGRGHRCIMAQGPPA